MIIIMNNEMNNSQAGATEQRTPKKLTFSVVRILIPTCVRSESSARGASIFVPAEQLAVTRFPPSKCHRNKSLSLLP
jgi:hypothetical protein